MPADMKEQIAHAAHVLLTEKNVKKLTVKDIVEECHITRQTFYYHFEDIPHLLHWIMVKEFAAMRVKTREQGGIEERIRYLFVMAAEVKPYVKKTMASNYGDELARLMKQEIMRLAEEIADDEHQYQNLTREEMRIVMQYHAQALLGLVWEWSDAPPEQITRISHTVYRIMSGKIVLTDDLDTGAVRGKKDRQAL